MFAHLKESTLFTFHAVWVALVFLCVIIFSLADWLKGFPLINKWAFEFFVQKLLIVIVGLLVTPLPLWVLIALSFAPLFVVGPLFFIAFIVAFIQF